MLPTEFHSHTTGEPFKKCISCEKNLLDPPIPYVIEKAVKKYEGYKAFDVIFEYALCFECADKMKNDLSTESTQRINDYFRQNIDFSKAQEMKNEESLKKCFITGTPKEELVEYQIFAYCNGDNLSGLVPPYMVSGVVMDEVADLLSNQTLDELNGFIDEHFGLPPELKPENLILV